MDIHCAFSYSWLMTSHNTNSFSLNNFSLVVIGLLLSTTLPAATLLIRGGTLIDMTGHPPMHNANILIEDDHISRIWQGSSESNYPSDTRIIEAKGKFIIPGLIDSHIHYNGYMGELFLAHGITTVNDLSSRPDWQTAVKKGLNSGQLRGPRYLYCKRIGKAEASEVAALVSAIRQQADCIRFDANSAEPLTIAVTAIADQSHIGVIAHSYDALKSARLGIDGVEHLEGVAISTIQSELGRKAVAGLTLEEGHKNPLLYQYMEPEHFDEVIQQLIAANVYLNPTLVHEWKGVINRTAQFEQDELRLLNQPSLQYIPLDEKLVSLGQYHWADPGLINATENEAVPEVFINNSYMIRTRTLRAQIEKGYRNIQQFLRRFVRAGGKLYSGTDTAAASTPGLSLHHEMQLYVDAGISTEAALASSTRWAAEQLRIEDKLGTISPGKLADLVILGADPLKDIANTRRIEQVLLAGKPVDTSYHSDYHFPFQQFGIVTKHLYHLPPVLEKVIPGIATQHSQTSIRITGENFVPESLVLFDGETVRTTWVSPTELSAVLEPRHTSEPGSYLLGVSTPAPGGGRVESLEFIIDYPE